MELFATRTLKFSKARRYDVKIPFISVRTITIITIHTYNKNTRLNKHCSRKYVLSIGNYMYYY